MERSALITTQSTQSWGPGKFPGPQLWVLWVVIRALLKKVLDVKVDISAS